MLVTLLRLAMTRKLYSSRNKSCTLFCLFSLTLTQHLMGNMGFAFWPSWAKSKLYVVSSNRLLALTMWRIIIINIITKENCCFVARQQGWAIWCEFAAHQLEAHHAAARVWSGLTAVWPGFDHPLILSAPGPLILFRSGYTFWLCIYAHQVQEGFFFSTDLFQIWSTIHNSICAATVSRLFLSLNKAYAQYGLGPRGLRCLLSWQHPPPSVALALLTFLCPFFYPCVCGRRAVAEIIWPSRQL